MQGIYQVVVLRYHVQPAYLEAVMARQARYQPRVLSGWPIRATADQSVQKRIHKRMDFFSVLWVAEKGRF